MEEKVYYMYRVSYEMTDFCLCCNEETTFIVIPAHPVVFLTGNIILEKRCRTCKVHFIEIVKEGDANDGK